MAFFVFGVRECWAEARSRSDGFWNYSPDGWVLAREFYNRIWPGEEFTAVGLGLTEFRFQEQVMIEF
jgi:hypothetical protein